MSNILIVGGAGFIGSSLCEKLLSNHSVVCLDNLLRGTKTNLAQIIDNPRFTFVEGDANDLDLLKDVMLKNKIEYVFHLAANSDIMCSANDPQIEFDCTAKTTWSILRAMRETNVKNIFFASTSAVYGEMKNGKPFEEDDPLCPVSYYGGAKMASEAFIKSFAYMNDFNALIFRFPNVIGPHLTHGVFFDFIDRLRANPKELRVLGNGTQRKPYMHVYDLIDAIDKLVWTNKGINIYNLGLETSVDVRRIAEMVISEMGIQDCKVIYGTESVGWKGDVPKFAYSLNKIHATGWKASMTSEEAALVTIREALK